MALRSDEAANQAEVERDKKFRGNVGKGIATAASLGSAVVAGPLAARVMPFLNEYIPAALAVKGISKVSPKLGAFLKKGEEMGMNVQGGLDFLKEKIGKGAEPPKENRNVIQQYSPELHQFIDSEIQKGRTAIEAGALAQNDKRFKDVISKLSKDHKSPWSSILETAYGSQTQQKSPSQNAQSIKDLLAQGAFGGQPQQSPPQGQQFQQGGGDQAKQQLMQAMQALTQKLRT